MIALGAVVAGTFLLAWQLTRLLAAGHGLLVLDHPNERSLHDAPIPRTGGVAIVAALLAGNLVLAALIGPPAHAVAIAAAAALVLIVSLLDDLHGVPVPARLCVHFLAATVLVLAGPGPPRLELAGASLDLPAAVTGAVAVLGVVWLVNLYNFMDGMDGFAGGMGLIGFAAIAVLAARGGTPGLAATATVIAAACGGFLILNFPPARIFMGDAGSSVLGLLAAAAALAGDAAGAFPAWLALLVFSPFVVDATVTLARRALRREPVWRAHRSHYYQRLVRLGWGHRRTTLWEYALMVACAASALVLQHAPGAVQLAGIAAWAVVYAMLAVLVGKLERCGRTGDSVPYP